MTSGDVLQRWRLLVARDEEGAELTQRDLERAWEAGLAGAGLPLARSGGKGRGGIALACPLSVGVLTEREPLDLYLTERWTIARLRTALEGSLPPGHRLVELHDVWVGAPALPASVEAAVYRCVIRCPAPVLERLRLAAGELIAAPRLERTRRKGDGERSYDLRPLLGEVRVEPAEDGVIVRLVLVHDPERGAGRPDEALGALAEKAGLTLAVPARAAAWRPSAPGEPALPATSGEGTAGEGAADEGERVAPVDLQVVRIVREGVLLRGEEGSR